MANELPNPITRDEKYLAKAAGVEVDIPTPITREEKYLNAIAEGGGGGFTPTETQLEAMNSGIDSTKVAQIETNKNNISSYCISKNLFNPSYNTNSSTGWTVTRNFDNTYRVVATGTNTQQFITIGSYTPAESGTYLWTVGAVGTQATAGMYIKVGDAYYWGGADEGQGQTLNLVGGTAYVVTLKISANQTLDILFKPMIRQTGDNTYEPYAKSNAELTTKAQANEADIISITPRTVLYTYTPTATDTYELIPQFTVTLPPNKTICITAAGYRNGNNKITGVQIQQSDTQDNENVIGIAESDTLYRCLTATGTYKNTSNANTTINVYIKCDAAGVLHNCNTFYWII